MAQVPPESEIEHLLRLLSHCCQELNAWIGESQANAALFLDDPSAAAQAAAANSGSNPEMMAELESVLSQLARKLHPPNRC